MKILSFNGKELYWKRIQLISFILAVFIIIRHNSSLANYNCISVSLIYDYFKYSITEIAVPLFFIISGFNYFKGFSMSEQKRKFNSRIKSLFVPYITWNTLYCIFCIIISFDFVSKYFIGREKFVITPLNVLFGCIYHWNCNSHFWFVFILMICVVINPVIYYALRKMSIGLVFLSALFVVVFLFNVNPPVEIIYRTDAFLYYYIGAFLGLHFEDFFCQDKLWIKNDNKYSGYQKVVKSHIFYIVSGIIYTLFALLLLIPNLLEEIRFIIILVSCYGFWKLSVCCRFIDFKYLPQGGTIFLMYAVHGIIQPVVVKLLYLALPKYDFVSLINFILSISITVLLCVGLRCFTKRYIPPVDKVITGWRR